jgi:hypothetical protein
MTPFARLLQYAEQHSGLGIACALIWLAMHRPFWRHVFMAASAMSFATLLLPEQMMFFTRHPALALGVLFTAGFAGAHLGANHNRNTCNLDSARSPRGGSLQRYSRLSDGELNELAVGCRKKATGARESCSSSIMLSTPMQ